MQCPCRNITERIKGVNKHEKDDFTAQEIPNPVSPKHEVVVNERCVKRPQMLQCSVVGRVFSYTEVWQIKSIKPFLLLGKWAGYKFIFLSGLQGKEQKVNAAFSDKPTQHPKLVFF